MSHPYFRFSVDRGLGNILLNEWEKDQEIAAITAAYLNFSIPADNVRRCVRALTTKEILPAEVRLMILFPHFESHR
jgi:hypothetical protein